MILCCGEALIDMIPEPTAQGREGFVAHSGGAIFNTAIGLGRLGCQVGFLSGVSTDMFGGQLIADLQASNVDTRFLIRSDRPTTLAFVQLTNGHASYSFFDENSAGRMIEPASLPTGIENISALCFGGISLACNPGADTYRHFARSHAKDHVIMMDPNIRPNFIHDAGVFRERMDEMISLTDIIKVSDEDLNWLIQTNDSLEDKAQALRDMGPAIVVLTRGSSGAQAWFADDQRITVPSQKVAVVDTVGAGDTFNAGLLAQLSDSGLLTKSAIRSISEADIKKAVTFGAQVAAVNVSRAGANPPWRDELTPLV